MSKKFCLILQTDGRLMANGKSKYGCLGVQNETDSNEKSVFVKMPSSELVVSIQVGDNHCLALTD